MYFYEHTVINVPEAIYSILWIFIVSKVTALYKEQFPLDFASRLHWKFIHLPCLIQAHLTMVPWRDTHLIEDLAIIDLIRLLALQLHQLRLSGIYSTTSAVVFWQMRKGRGLTRCGLFLGAVEARLQRVSAIC